MIDWRIYYGDGSTFDNEDGPPEAAPCTRVICVAFYDEDNRRKICHQADYYLWQDNSWDGFRSGGGKAASVTFSGRWFSADISGFMQYLQEPGLKVVKFGREIGDNAYRAVMTKALNNDLPLARAAP